MEETCTISIIIPALGEAAVISGTVADLKRLSADTKSTTASEIIVVDGSPEGSTIAALDDSAVVTVLSERGRARQMNAGAARASGRVLLFLHADTVLPPDALRLIGKAMGSGRYVAGAFALGIRSERFAFRAIERLASFRSRLTRIPFGDQAIFIRRDYFEEMGGYEEIPLMEDMALMRRIKKRGGRIILFSERVTTSPRRWEKEGILFCTLRNWTLQALYYAGVSPQRLMRFYK